jgi:hypothetical protein
MSRNFLFNYIVVKITSSLFLFTILCLILAELVGISFEQMRLIVDDKISVSTSREHPTFYSIERDKTFVLVY